MRVLVPLLVPMALALLAAGALAQPKAAEVPIYVCTDAKGRRITSDRPIMECLDREQKQYGTGGTVRNTLPPSMTADERTAAEDKARKDNEVRLRQADLRRRDRVLLGRYRDESSHQRERAESLTRVDDIIATGERRLQELQGQREDLALQAENAAKDIVKSSRLKRSLEENDENQAAQRRLLAAQRDERERITTRFDEELSRLKTLWAQQAARPAPRPNPP